MDTTHKETTLIGIPHYQQGDADGLCVYYAMSMVLVALYPEYHRTIHESPQYRKGGSPIFGVLKEISQGDKKFKEAVGEWYFSGMQMADATKLLNNLSRKYYKDTRETNYFIRRRVKTKNAKKNEWNVSDICHAIDWHLPVIIAGGGIQNHAIVVIGWGSKGRLRWITFHDPGLGRANWAYAKHVFYDDCEAIVPNWDHFEQHRPPAIITQNNKTYYEAWKPEMML